MRVTSKGQVTIPQAIRERCGLLPHTEVHFVEEGGRVFLQKDDSQPCRGDEAVQRLQQARLRTRLSTDQLLALTRGDSETGDQL
ncbi:MAG: AbrB/MazE/SpoVT family DNA-binding domain-containing protein [Cyanobacteria bacterium]|nr:AbrB/MazE/SpoVT family DNA-binding domain-containing protein [Cyanobacteriota bacterium]